MKNLVRFAVAGAMLAGFATAQAQSVPSSGSADLWLFVSDVTAGTTFAEDLGSTESLSTILPTSSLLAANSANPPTLATANGATGATLNIGPTTALSTYLSTAEGKNDTIQWAVDGIQYPSVTTANKTTKAPGGILDITDELGSQGGNLSQMIFSGLQTIGNSFSPDVAYLSQTYKAGGTTYAWSAGTGSGNVWGASNQGLGGSTTLYGQGPDQAGVGLGTATTLFGLTGNGGLAQVQSYVLATNLTLSSTGTLSSTAAGGSTPPPPVPLPAAVWLFGSGLLGLLGVGRRRAASAA